MKENMAAIKDDKLQKREVDRSQKTINIKTRIKINKNRFVQSYIYTIGLVKFPFFYYGLIYLLLAVKIRI